MKLKSSQKKLNTMKINMKVFINESIYFYFGTFNLYIIFYQT